MTVGSQVKSCYSSIKSVEASLEIMSTKTQHNEAKEAFEQTKHIISGIKDDLDFQVIQLSKQEPQYK